MTEKQFLNILMAKFFQKYEKNLWYLSGDDSKTFVKALSKPQCPSVKLLIAAKKHKMNVLYK